MFYLTTHSRMFLIALGPDPRPFRPVVAETHCIYGYIAPGIWLQKEANVLFNDALNTLHLRYMATGIILWLKKEDMFYLMTHSTHLIYGYIASGIWLKKECFI